ncbi:HD domain-containing protein [Halobacillus rhizosphaerae]|uniref:HD domain-containing protein n=1 Tax=Halobacillus rhizosphaerae TaxID=3064889 RepID=UPI00398B8BF7
MDKQTAFDRIHQFVRQQFAEDYTGHDYEHMVRVASWSKALAHKEGADPFICETTGLLHDIGDHKLFSYPDKALEQRDILLTSLGYTNTQISLISDLIETISFSKGQVPSTLEGRVVQDADRLDAIGAIGIARTFAYGGANGQPIHSFSDQATSFRHFQDKLLMLVHLMNTESGRKEAEHRHDFMIKYVEEFNKEWNAFSTESKTT